MELELGDYLKFVVALIFVLALIAGLTTLARRFGYGFRTPIRGGKQRRLDVIEILPLDAKRRLVLVRRDDIEHLLLLGPGSDLIVEGGIGRQGMGSAVALGTTGASHSAPDESLVVKEIAP